MAADADVTVELAGGYRFDGLERLIAALQPLAEIDTECLVRVDLSRLAFVGPTALAVLTAEIHRLEELGYFAIGSMLVPPKNRLTRNYLMRMDFLDVLELQGPPEPFERKDPVGFRPCQRFTGPEDYWQVAKELSNALVEKCVTDDTAKASIRICTDEVTENVVHHADSSLGGFAVAQGGKKEFEIGIVDRGVGIRTSLAKNPEYADIGSDALAIATALRPRVTSTPERNAGIGLFVTAHLLAANGGSIIVRSGNGEVRHGAKASIATLDQFFGGTIVAIRAKMDRPLDIKAVYRHLDDLDHADNDGNNGKSQGRNDH